MEKSIYETGHQMGNMNTFFAWLLLLFLPFTGTALIALVIYACALSPIATPTIWIKSPMPISGWKSLKKLFPLC